MRSFDYAHTVIAAPPRPLRTRSLSERQRGAVRQRSTVANMPEHDHGEPRFDEATQAAEWDARYNEREGSTWSGRPNGRLVADVTGLTAGRALDVGCGEGADAIWLARRGWKVTAIDVSEVAIGRARTA